MDRERDIIISCKGVSKTFIAKNRKQNEVNNVVEGLDLIVYRNEFVVLFGPGQCGKTTILNLICGLETVTAGEIIVNGSKVDGPKPDKGMVYQTTALFPWMTVEQNVSFGPRMLGVPKPEWKKRTQYYIDLVGLTGFEKSYPVKLSGGMQQRVGIARAYCNNPELICMDEPFGHLDAQTRYLMEEEIERLCSKERRTVVFVTNNVEEAIYLADRILILTPTPTKIQSEYIVDLPRPRDYTSKKFLELRDEITREVEGFVE
ncbi:MAG TPA: ABC transporter ATP-binding protein [Salinivirgaceae bacterium]|nr:ABC transporter ATP-binding protein [Salinivirgaceae bacterium]